jgi:hypothetical protein
MHQSRPWRRLIHLSHKILIANMEPSGTHVRTRMGELRSLGPRNRAVDDCSDFAVRA